jgi:1-phosphatidylinositol phosphodiesterase
MNYPQVTRRHRQIVILHRRNLASFLADMPDQVPLSSLLLPGMQLDLRFFHYGPI